jgi:predicted nuclease with TOPRIM domain
MMQEQLQRRLEELKKEYETGQARLRELESETAYVRETMLRISGAIQVIQEILEKDEQQDDRVESVQTGQADS